MSIHQGKGCSCSHHRLLNFIQEGMNDEATSLLQKLEDPCDAIKSSKTTLLHCAVQYKNTIMIQPLIDHGCNVNAKDSSGSTPLMLAIQNPNLTAVDILLKNNADVYVSNSSGDNSLQMACLKLYDFVPFNLNESIEFAVLKKLFEKANSDFFKDKKTTKQLVLKANKTVKLAVVANANVELAKIVLDAGYPLNYRESRRGFTALHVAIYFQNIENILLLIEHGADVDAQDYSYYSAIHCYLSDCQDVDENSEVLKSLLSRTKGLYSPNEKRESDFEHFLMTGNEKTVRAVLQKTAQSDINVSAMKFHGGKSLLHILTENFKEPDVCKILDEFDIQYDINACDANKCTALTLALQSGRYGAADFLLKRGAKVTMTKRETLELLDATDLLHSNSPRAQDHMPNIVAILLEHGVDVQCVFKGGKSLIKRLCYQRANKVLNTGEKMIIAHLALLAKIKNSALTDLTRKDIESEPLFKDYFDFCTKQLDELKKVEVHGNVTLLNLLTKDQEQITAYARNEEFISAFESVMEQNSHLERYYSTILNRRVAKAIDVSKFQMQLARIIEKLTGICSDVYSTIAYKIINYLNEYEERIVGNPTILNCHFSAKPYFYITNMGIVRRISPITSLFYPAATPEAIEKW